MSPTDRTKADRSRSAGAAKCQGERQAGRGDSRRVEMFEEKPCSRMQTVPDPGERIWLRRRVFWTTTGVTNNAPSRLDSFGLFLQITAEVFHSYCGKLEERRVFNRVNLLNKKIFLPLCINNVQWFPFCPVAYLPGIQLSACELKKIVKRPCIPITSWCERVLHCCRSAG